MTDSQTQEIRFFGGGRLTLVSRGSITRLIAGGEEYAFSQDGLDQFIDLLKARQREIKRGVKKREDTA